ncbi:MAG: amidophosphoribosyltransferase [Alphaproteobacteria bacterium]|nr:amidophosphoribosyltransferase [Alphaproteobacteria bacterium]
MAGTTNPFAHRHGQSGADSDKFHEECGVFGIIGSTDAAAHTVLGLHALQHRGQEAAGIVTHDGGQFFSHRSLGHVGDNFNSESVISRLPGDAALGHNRYATTGDTILRNVQPLFAELQSGGFAIGHNGNLTNSGTLRSQLVQRGCIFQSTMDTEVITHLIATSSYHDLLDRMIDALKAVVGAYSLVAMTEDKLIGVRDPMGVRPLILGHLEGAPILTSETCALDIIGAEFVREVAPGELIVCSRDGIESLMPFPPAQSRPCIFEYVYFSRPDSITNGRSIYTVRKAIGAHLARESAVGADVVIPVPDSGTPAAIGYAEEAGVPFELGIIRNHYVGRTFIEPSQSIRNFGVKLKHNANRAEIEGRRVVLVDDSIVRGTTSSKIVQMVRDAGAQEVHMRIASPPTANPCYYGIDTPSREELMAANLDVESMGRQIGVDSLAFISINGLYRAVGGIDRDEEQPQYCDACFTDQYPVSLVDLAQGRAPAQLSLLAEHS